MTRKTHLPDLLIERMALDELPPGRMEALRRTLAEEEGGPERLEAISASNQAILEQYPPARMASAIRQRIEVEREAGRGQRKSGSWLRGLALAAPIAVAAAIALVWVFGSDRSGDQPRLPGTVGPEVTRLKGPVPKPKKRGATTKKGALLPHLVVYRTTNGGGIERLPARAMAKSHDRIQLSYVAQGHKFGAVISIDGRGGVSLHHPKSADQTPTIKRQGETPLPFSIELDDAPGYERFFMVYSDTPFDVRQVLEAARQLVKKGKAGTGNLVLPESLKQTAFTLRKGELL